MDIFPEPIVEPTPKKRGRKPTINVKDNRNEYYKQYYRENNGTVCCDQCGLCVKKQGLSHHRTSNRHRILSVLKQLQNPPI